MMTTAGRRPPDEQHVRAMFDAIVKPYDPLNRLLSLGLDRPWRRRALSAVSRAAGSPLLDLGCGTGEFAHLFGRPAGIVGVDVSGGMLGRARIRLGPSARLIQGSAFRLPFPNATFSGAVSGFVLRNLDDLATAFAELGRVLRPRAPLALLDATEPVDPRVRSLFDAYFGTVAPLAGALVGHGTAYRYLARSLVQLPGAADLVRMLTSAGFRDCHTDRLAFGSVLLVTATRSGA